MEERFGHALEPVILAREQRRKGVAVELFPARHAAKERGELRETIELEIICGRKRDVARVAQDINDPSFRIVRQDAQIGQLMMRLVAAEIGNTFFAFGCDFVFI